MIMDSRRAVNGNSACSDENFHGRSMLRCRAYGFRHTRRSYRQPTTRTSMKHKTKLAALIAGLTLAGSSAATAQTQTTKPIFVDVNAGAQTQSRTLITTTSFPLYGETAVINSAQGIDGGGLFDISGGYRILRQFSIGIGFSAFSKTGSGTIAASIPNPAVINRPA